MRAVIATFIAVFLALIAFPAHSQSIDQANIDCLARGMYHEARAESVEGIKAVGYVILNRTGVAGKFPGNPCGVIYQKGQFVNIRTLPIKDKKTYSKVREIAEQVYNAPQGDNTNGATYFHNVKVKPHWGKKMIRTAKYGNHIFFKQG